MPYVDKEYGREHRRLHKIKMRALDPRYGQQPRERYKAKRMLPFVGVDGEGGNVPDGSALFGTRHEYFLLRAGEHVLETGKALSSRECLAFLADLPGGVIYAGFFLDYDITMWLRDLSPERMRRVLRKTSQLSDEHDGVHRSIYAPIEVFDQFEVRYLPGKEFAVRRKGRKNYTVVSDMGPFFACTFVEALRKWNIGTDEQRGMISAGKTKRATFGHLTEDTEAYNKLEIELFEQLAEEFRSACVDLGYVPDRWQGPGRLAAAMLEKHGIPRGEDIKILKNKKFRQLANAAYYGGRFECMMHGPVNRPVYEFDICSAYPNAMTHLPCLVHGTWERKTQWDDDEPLYFAHIEFDHPDSPDVCNLPVRSRKGGLYWPKRGSGVYWSVEIDAAIRAGTVITARHEAYVYRPGRLCTCKPFDFLHDLYQERKNLGKSSKGMALKLGMNSLYGKLAQSVGTPPWANPVWAGLITAYTRADIIDAYNGHQDNVVMIATDAVYMLDQPDLDLGSGLGQWEKETHATGLFIVQPGLYYENYGGGDHRNKTRGMAPSVFDKARGQFEECWDRMWREHDPYVTVNIPINQFMGLTLAVHLKRYDQAGQWFDESRKFGFATDNKRGGMWIDGWRGGLVRSYPIEPDEAVESVPYKKVIGAFDEDRTLRSTQPDWAPLFFHQ